MHPDRDRTHDEVSFDGRQLAVHPNCGRPPIVDWVSDRLPTVLLMQSRPAVAFSHDINVNFAISFAMIIFAILLRKEANDTKTLELTAGNNRNKRCSTTVLN